MAGLVVRQDDLNILLDLDRKEEGFQGPLIPLLGDVQSFGELRK